MLDSPCIRAFMTCTSPGPEPSQSGHQPTKISRSISTRSVSASAQGQSVQQPTKKQATRATSSVEPRRSPRRLGQPPCQIRRRCQATAGEQLEGSVHSKQTTKPCWNHGASLARTRNFMHIGPGVHEPGSTPHEVERTGERNRGNQSHRPRSAKRVESFLRRSPVLKWFQHQ